MRVDTRLRELAQGASLLKDCEVVAGGSAAETTEPEGSSCTGQDEQAAEGSETSKLDGSTLSLDKTGSWLLGLKVSSELAAAKVVASEPSEFPFSIGPEITTEVEV